MDADSEKLLMAFMEGTLDEQGASRLLDRLDADPDFLAAAVRHWRMDRLLDAGVAGADEAAEALRRSVRIRLEGSAVESVELSQQVGSRLRSRKGSGIYRRVSGRRRWLPSNSAPQAVAWAVGGALAASVLIAVVLSSTGRSVAPPAPRGTSERTSVAPPVERPVEKPAEIGPHAPAPAEAIRPRGPSEPVPSSERRPTLPAPKPAVPGRAPRTVEPPKKPAPARPTVPATPTKMAVLESVEGPVFVLSGGQRIRARNASDVLAGTGLEIGARGRAAVRYPDGTLVEVESGALIREFAAGPSGGKSILLSRGSLRAAVTPQPDGKAMILATPQAEARVLGTEFTLSIEAGATRLEVREGKVRLTRLRDRAHVDVAAGHFAVAHPARTLVTRPLPASDPLVIELETFGTARGVKPAEGRQGRMFLEAFPDAAGGNCVAVPGVGTEIRGELTLEGRTSYLWIRYRDDDGGSATFDVLAGGTRLAQIACPGTSKNWYWKRIALKGRGRVRLTLRSTYKGIVQTASNAGTRIHPYAVVNRWDQIILTRDEGFVPANK